MLAALDAAVSAGLPQMGLYRRVGEVICERPEKGAAVAAAKYLAEKHPEIAGFSPPIRF